MGKALVLWIVGPPGVGKTTLVRALMDRLDPLGARYLVPKPKWTVAPGVFTAAGHYTGDTFDGADTVPYNGVEASLESWANDLTLQTPLVIFDGDRFSLEKVIRFFDRSGNAPRNGPDVITRVALVATEDAQLLTARRAARGSNQNPSWMAGRATKSRRFAESWLPSLHLDASRPTLELVDELEEHIRALQATPDAGCASKHDPF